VGNNEFDDAWLDEGIDTFSSARAYAEHFGKRGRMRRFFVPPGTNQDGFLPLLFPQWTRPLGGLGRRLDRYRRSATADLPAWETYRYHPGTAADITYSKTALWLATLERFLGWERLRSILSTFFERYKFRHPRPEDFFAVASEMAGEDLDWFFEEVFYSSVRFDYGIASVESFPLALEGLDEEAGGLVYRPKADEDSGPFRSQVVLRRYGEGVFPVDVLLVFEDGRQVRHRWDGRERWKMFSEDGPAKLHHAVVDPERILLLDVDYANNSRLRRPEPELAVLKWASRWLIWMQDRLAAFAFFS
jgi:hypothetical protein